MSSTEGTVKSHYLLSILAFVIAGCISDTTPHSVATIATDLDDSGTVEANSILTAIEGLPRFPNTASVDGDTYKIREYSFYNGRISLPPEDEKRVITILESKHSYEPHTEKLCGGFHPDWAIEIDSRFGPTVYLICFGCDEAIVMEGIGGYFPYDLADDARDALYDILITYHVNVPAEDRPEARVREGGSQ